MERSGLPSVQRDRRHATGPLRVCAGGARGLHRVLLAPVRRRGAPRRGRDVAADPRRIRRPPRIAVHGYALPGGRPQTGRPPDLRVPAEGGPATGVLLWHRLPSVIDFGDPDGEMARRAISQLRSDLNQGFDHLLMARFNRIGRARELLPLYQQEAPDLNPVDHLQRPPKRDQQAALDGLFSRESRIVVCVDMLGEGFDLPALKVAAIHDPHKSLGVTLQFVGRFAGPAATIGRRRCSSGAPSGLRPSPAAPVRRGRRLERGHQRPVRARDAGRGRIDEFERGFRHRPDDVPMRASPRR